MVSIFIKMTLRLAIGLLALIIYMNLLGRMQLSPQSAVDQIGNYILGGILGGIIYNLDLEFYKFFMAIIIWTSLMLLVNFITQRNLRAKRAIKGHPTLLMESNEFLTEKFKKNKINLDDIMSKLHQKGIHSITEVKTIWLEPNGQLTTIMKSDDNIGWVLIEDGQINYLDLFRLNKSKEWLEDEIRHQGFDSIDEIFYGEYLNERLILYKY
ncbi:MAG: DUF421 domain-containing protein [Peptostreptococcus sp.]|uniref:DUF421 domain-containing protein n=1 Tax=Peptostreptococcus sp. TaxID=1262 RepID=UPI002FCC4A80